MQLGIRSPIRYTKAAYTFPKNGVLDNFNRADGDAGANWVDWTSYEQLTIYSNRVAGAGSWITSPGSADAEAYYTLPYAPGWYDDGELGLYDQVLAGVRLSNEGVNSTDGYAIFYSLSSFGTIVEYGIYRFDNGTLTLLGSSYGGEHFTEGEKFGISIIGSNMLAYHKPTNGDWQLLVPTRTDSTYTSGRIGLAVWHNADLASGDDFGGGTI